ncbi:MAG: hypothetical protein U0T83_05745 [Bacteriovoracaceae bacterium]
MQKSSYIFIAILSISMSSPSFARVRNFETTRLKSTAGAGVGSLLVNESVISNPGSLSFFNISSIYLQKESMQLKNEDTGIEAHNKHFKKQSDNFGVIVADSSNSIKGALGYIQQQEGYEKRKRVSAAAAMMLGKNSSLGTTYHYTEDINFPEGRSTYEEKYHQVTFGATHVIDTWLSFGVVFVDPFKAHSADSKLLLGTQIVISDIVAIMLDGGGNYSENMTDSLLYRAALQVNFIGSLYLRGGVFDDRSLSERGFGYGVGWITPNLVFDLAMKTTKSTNDHPTYNYLKLNNKLSELSFALTYRF